MAQSAIHPFQPSMNVDRRSRRTSATPSLAGGAALAHARVAPSRDQGIRSPTEQPEAVIASASQLEVEGRHSGPKYLDRILIRKTRRMLLVRTTDIELIEAAGNYVRINTADAQHLLRSPLAELAANLDPRRFLRIHRSAIVNTDFLESVETNPAGDYHVRMPNGRRLKCSRSYRADLRQFLERFGS